MRTLRRWLVWGGLILGAVCALLYLLVFDVWVVPHDPWLAASVLPTLVPEDKILVQRGRTPRFGELARCTSATSPSGYVVGRVYGAGGDRVEVRPAAVVTNGTAESDRQRCDPVVVAHPETQNLITMSCALGDTGYFTYSRLYAPELETGTQLAAVEDGKLFLVSDNRLMHQDSRDFGMVEASSCEHIVYRLWGERFTDPSRRFTVVW